MNVIGVSKFMFAMITLMGCVCFIIAVIVYAMFLKETEVRLVLFWNASLAIGRAFINYCFAMRWNLEVGIDDYYLVIFSDVVYGSYCMTL